MITRVVGLQLLAFHVSDTHIHVIVLADRARAGRLAQALALALAAATGVTLPPAAITPIHDADHLRAAFEYVLCNDEKHGIVPDPWRENTNLPDLLGARRVAVSTIGAVREYLPRVSGVHLRALAGWADVPQVPVTLALLREHVAAAALAVVAHVALSSRLPEVRMVVTAACQLARRVEMGAEETAGLLGVSASTAYRKCASSRADLLVTDALLLQIGLRVARPILDVAPFGAEPARTPWSERRKMLPR